MCRVERSRGARSGVDELLTRMIMASIVAVAGCAKDKCTELPPTLELHLKSSDAAMFGSLDVRLLVGAERYRRIYEIGSELRDGETSLAVAVAPPPTSTFGLEISVYAHALGMARGATVARAHGALEATADGCNRFELTLDPESQPDAGQASDASAGGDGSTDIDHDADGSVPTDASSPRDAAPDGGPVTVDFPYVPSNFTGPIAPERAVTLSCQGTTFSFNTDTGLPARWCDATPSSELRTQANGTMIRLVRVGDLTIPEGVTLRLEGTLPLIIVSTGNVSVAGRISANANLDSAGPGGGSRTVNMAQCANAIGSGGAGPSGGGGGGSFGGAGGRGGAGGGGGAGGAAGANSGTAELMPLRGGCGGGPGAGGGGDGGAGGGAFQISARGTITLDSDAVLVAGGGGGRAGDRRAGGGGGGSGGAILLEADTLALAGMIAANGGSGGEGGDTNNPGSPGIDGNLRQAEGGSGGGNGGDGGDGYPGLNINGSPGGATNMGGGGGGGGAGRIHLRAVSGCTASGNRSPTPTTNGAPGC